MIDILLIGLSLVSAPGDPDLLIANEYVEVGVSEDFGGAITWLSLPGHPRNLVNNHDKGRQVQQSIYAGQDVDRKAEGQRKNWSPWPWNPVQAGDTYGNKSKILEFRATESDIYTKVQPLLWDMNNEVAEAIYETWITLEGPAVRVHNKVTCFRTDDRWVPVVKGQELPACYTIGGLHQLYTYDGANPWAEDALTLRPRIFPAERIYATENWAAYVDESLWGVGVYNPDIDWIAYMFHGEPPGETADAATGYISPTKEMVLEKNSTFTYDYYLVVGHLQDIRKFVYVKAGKARAEDFHPPLPAPPPADAVPPAQRPLAGWIGFAGVMALVLGACVMLWRRSG